MSTCFAIQYPVFQPAMRLIAAITNSNPMVVTTTFAHQYKTAVIVRLDLPEAVGMQQANQLFAPITVTGSETFTMPFDSTNFDIFAIPVDPLPQVNTCAMCVPIGEQTSNLDSAIQNVLPYSAT
jgi:hypothetical protein